LDTGQAGLSGDDAESGIAAKNFAAGGTKSALSPSRQREGGGIEMRRLPIIIALDPMKFVQAFAAGLQAQFAGAACAPLPEYLAALMRELEDGDQKPPTPNLRKAA
jgi:hypothetical protein